MSKVLNILVEGQTELEFVRELITPYFNSKGISHIRPITIETSPGHKGGDIRYKARYKSNIQKILKGKEDLLVTSLIDFYRLRKDFPNFEESQNLTRAADKVKLIEEGCAKDINDHRFIPYIQLHEFEGLLFSKATGFEELFPNLERSSLIELINTINEFPNPELINDSPNSAPSKRLERLIPNYQKPLYGCMIALTNEFNSILIKCPRFNNWIETLVEKMNE